MILNIGRKRDRVAMITTPVRSLHNFTSEEMERIIAHISTVIHDELNGQDICQILHSFVCQTSAGTHSAYCSSV